MKTKIALIGSAPSSVKLAPYDDPEWEIWACSPGVYGVAPRTDAYFELHLWEPPVPGKPGTGKPWFSPEYCEFLARYKGTVWVAQPVPEIANAVVYPFDEMIAKYGPFFFTSSLSWMLALALQRTGVTEIGLWGVDMSATEEYQLQRPGCWHFITEAMKLGIKVTVPPESDLLQPPFLYGLNETSPMAIKLTARRAELQSRLSDAQAREAAASREMLFYQGALDDLQYFWNTWVTYQTYLQPTRSKTGNEERAVIQPPKPMATPACIQAMADHADQYDNNHVQSHIEMSNPL